MQNYKSFNKEHISVFLPVRKGSERVKNKSVKNFAGKKGGLLKVKLEVLLKLDIVDEIILSTNDQAAIEIGLSVKGSKGKIIINERPDELAQSYTNLEDLIKYVPTVCNYSNILWTHVTSPFVTEIDYMNSIHKYFEKINDGFDSLMSVKKLNGYIWDKELNDIINRDNRIKWPRTQDLKPLFEVNSAIFIANKKIYLNQNDRIGKKPYLFELDNLKSFDIDWEEDFKIAELLYDKI